MFNYLYYKLYRASLKSSLQDIPAFFTAILMGTLLSTNILVITMLLFKLEIIPLHYSSKNQASISTFLLIALIGLYYNKRRRLVIFQEYEKESENKRKRGNMVVTLYVALSFISIFAVAFFKPGRF